MTIIYLFILLVSGCSVNHMEPLTKNYVGLSPEKIVRDSEFILTDNEPIIVKADDYNEQINELRRHGYCPVGNTWHYGSQIDAKTLTKYAKKYHADYVLVSSVIHKKIPNKVPNPKRTGNSSQDSGALVGHGLSQTMIYLIHGTHTNYYNTVVGLFVKRKPTKLGILCDDIPSEIKLSDGISKGSLISLIFYGSLAEKAGLREGDIIVRVDGVQVYNAEHFRELRMNIGKGVHDFSIYRYGMIQDFQINFP